MLAAVANPLIPAWYDLVWSGLAVVVIAFAVTALVSLARAKDVTGMRALGWILVVLCLPVAGSAAWFLWGRRASTASA